MQVDALSVELRPRPMAEATDLGVRLVQAHAASVWRTCGPVFAAVIVVALSTVEIASWLPMFIIFWLKPWLDRSVLFVLSRAVFGQSTRFADLWQAQSRVWWGQMLRTLLLRRLSPWRSFTHAIHQLEGQNGDALRQRRGQLLRGQRGAAFGMHAAFAHVEVALQLGLMAVLLWFAPMPEIGDFFTWLSDSESTSAVLLTTGIYACVVMLLEPFYVAAGFAMYLNRRVELEAWDIEQEFRRAFAV